MIARYTATVTLTWLLQGAWMAKFKKEVVESIYLRIYDNERDIAEKLRRIGTANRETNADVVKRLVRDAEEPTRKVKR